MIRRKKRLSESKTLGESATTLGASTATALMLCLALSIPSAVDAQPVGRFGVRGGVGVDVTGRAVYTAQVDLTDVGATHSIELALAAFGARRDQAYSGARGQYVRYDYEEITHVEGVAVVGSILLGHARGGNSPYLVAGTGVGALWVDWRWTSPNDPGLGTPRVPVGSFRAERVVKLGSVWDLGVGLRVLRGVDVRVQARVIVVPSTVAREDLKFMPTITLNSGVGL